MKTININQLQSQVSRVMKDVEGGEAYEVLRYSRPVAIIQPKKPAEQAPKMRCEECIGKLNAILAAVRDKVGK